MKNIIKEKEIQEMESELKMLKMFERLGFNHGRVVY